MAAIGDYILLAAEGDDRAGQMHLSDAYRDGGWRYMMERVRLDQFRIASLDGQLACAVFKYPFGQRPGTDGPRVLDMLMLRDIAVAPGVCGTHPMQGRDGMQALAAWCRRRVVTPVAYFGAAPRTDEFYELIANPRDVEFVVGWIMAMAGCGFRIVFDSGSDPVWGEHTRRFIEWLGYVGCGLAFDSEAFAFEAPEGTWPNVPFVGTGVRCWGENDAWAASGMPRGGLACGAGLLHTHNGASDDVLAAAAQPGENGWVVAVNIHGMDNGSLGRVVTAAADGDWQPAHMGGAS